MIFSLLSGCLEHLSSLQIKLVCDIALKIANEFVMALKELTIFHLIGGQRFKCVPREAFLVALEVFGHVVAHEGVQEIQLEVVLGVELFALCSLGVCIVIVGVAFVGESSE